MKTLRMLLAAWAVIVAAPRFAVAQSAAAEATAARISGGVGAQSFASATLPASGGMNTAEVDVAAVSGTLGAEGLRSITSGQSDTALVTVTATAEAVNVDLVGGLIRADVVLALATSYASGSAAASESDGSALLGLVVNGVSYGDAIPAANTRIALPGVGYVVLNEQIASGDGRRSTELTVNMIHVYLTDPVSGAPAGDIVVGSARSAASR